MFGYEAWHLPVGPLRGMISNRLSLANHGNSFCCKEIVRLRSKSPPATWLDCMLPDGPFLEQQFKDIAACAKVTWHTVPVEARLGHGNSKATYQLIANNKLTDEVRV